MDALQSSSTDVNATFYYYAGETDDEIGLYYWGSNISTTAEEATWNVYTSNKAYLFTPVTGYEGWYSIPMTISEGGADSGFQIFVSSDTSAPVPDGKYGGSDNTDIYGKLADGTNETCAYKNGKNYSGTDEATGLDKAAAIMRNVTFYVLSEEIVPAIWLSEGSLAKVNEEDGSITTLTNSGTADNANVYELEPVAGKENWYSLAFAVPGSITLGGGTVCKLYYKTETGYTWAKDLVNGSTNNAWEADFTPYLRAEIIASMSMAKGILLSSASMPLWMKLGL